MKQLGDIQTIKNAPFVDCITFGSPCQDLSIAGKRAGLAGERSGLFMEAVRIIKEMEEQSGGLYPTFAIWENVPGAFSSNKGRDFQAVLEELAKIKESEASIPQSDKWAKAGFICGNGWSIAWRTLDAQFWGVPQRRRRIALIMDLRGQRAGKILFERKGLPGDFEPSIPPWEGIARNPADGTFGHDRREICIPINDKSTRWKGGGKTRNHDGSGNGLGVGNEFDPMFTLTAGDRHTVCYGIASLSSNSMKSSNPNSGFFETNVCKTLDLNAANPTCNQGGIVVVQRCDSVICKASGQTSSETLEEICPTLNCNHEQPIVFESHSQDARYTQQGDTSPSYTAQWGTGGNNMPLVAEKYAPEIAHVLRAKANCSFREDAETYVAEKHIRWIVRRLTPTECERLQGYPDGWTDIGEWVDSKGKRHKPADIPRYKALGNSIALPQWWWITCKMARYLPERATLGSLFDGIGGFPLVWETFHGKGTALWASEIEEFPIAVTKIRFPEGE